MNITFFIGNGFDRNLGLNTTFADFVKEYKKTKSSSETLENFKNYIDDNEELWSSAEIAMGEYTKEFKAGAALAFSECHTDFCDQMARYLKIQESRIDYDQDFPSIENAFSNLNYIGQTFPVQERDEIRALYSQHIDEPVIYNFICFNYTRTLDNCLNIVEDSIDIIGSHKNRNDVIKHRIGETCHVHGTVDGSMVFGVNDESQISNLEVFNCEDGDIYRDILIKIKANQLFAEKTDEKANQLLMDSSLIYIYGMSIGETDKLWWDRICQWLARSPRNHLIVQKHKMPEKSVTRIQYIIAEQKAKKDITKHCTFSNNMKKNIEQRIHIANDNIFIGMRNIAGELTVNEKRDLELAKDMTERIIRHIDELTDKDDAIARMALQIH